jgi:hypothetical protein
MMAEPWWVESVGPKPKQRRLDASEVRLLLDRVLTHYFREQDGQALIVAPEVREDRWDKAHCPFHRDKKASASVNWGKSRFRCHACDIGGDAIDLVMEQENLQFREAMEWIEAL